MFQPRSLLSRDHGLSPIPKQVLLERTRLRREALEKKLTASHETRPPNESTPCRKRSSGNRKPMDVQVGQDFVDQDDGKLRTLLHWESDY